MTSPGVERIYGYRRFQSCILSLIAHLIQLINDTALSELDIFIHFASLQFTENPTQGSHEVVEQLSCSNVDMTMFCQ